MAKNHARAQRNAKSRQLLAPLKSVSSGIAPALRGGAMSVERVPGHRTGSIVAVSERGPVVDYRGNPHGPIAARTIVALPAAVAADAPRAALLVFEDERSDRPIVVGLLEPRGAPGRPLTAVVDGQQVVIEGRDEIVLRCGEATITLRRNGRVVIRGAYVETRSRGVNRIKGGSVQIN